QSLVQQAAGEVKADQGRVDKAQRQLSQTRITAPISGQVGLAGVGPGNVVGPSDADGIVVVSRLHPADVAFSLPTRAASHVLRRLAAGACIPVALRGENSTADAAPVTGRLMAADNAVDSATGTVRMKAR